MPSAPTLFLHGKVYFVSFRTEEGLPFVHIPLINELLLSCLTKAQQLYFQEIIAITMEPNHCHMLIKVVDPESVPSFIGYFKQESAHAVNRLLGRRKKTIWADGYDKPIILDYKKLLDKFAYLILNPVKDLLVSNINLYKGLSSWQYFLNQQNHISCRLFSRSSITPLANPNAAWKESANKLLELKELNKGSASLELNYYSWKSAFPETAVMADSEVRELMLNAVYAFELELKASLPTKYQFPDLEKQSMLKTYSPTKFSARMLCLSFFDDLRIEFISFFQEKISQAKAVYALWKTGQTSIPFPAGMFAPSPPRLVNIVPSNLI